MVFKLENSLVVDTPIFIHACNGGQRCHLERGSCLAVRKLRQHRRAQPRIEAAQVTSGIQMFGCVNRRCANIDRERPQTHEGSVDIPSGHNCSGKTLHRHGEVGRGFIQPLKLNFTRLVRPCVQVLQNSLCDQIFAPGIAFGQSNHPLMISATPFVQLSLWTAFAFSNHWAQACGCLSLEKLQFFA